jgi:hypothetical protein
MTFETWLTNDGVNTSVAVKVQQRSSGQTPDIFHISFDISQLPFVVVALP